MANRLRSRWVSYQETPLFGINLCGFEANRQGLQAEIEAVEAILRQQLVGSVLAVVDIAQSDMTPALAGFIQAHNGGSGDPIRKMAIVGAPAAKRFWYRLHRKVTWPLHAGFFDDHESAKAWLVAEQY